ncbi:MAG: SDR family NAD(P)-dependent oxidoreductase, partial [Bacteroidetes bacterium]|nr:SDR family NAD(P)-dependent oxidoreductase [Bacteroidota bacterium]
MSFSNKEKTRISSKYGPWALITGASSGIGKELAIRLAEAGMHLVIIARNKDRLIQLSDELSGKFGVEVISITADLANEREVQQVIQRTQNLEIGLFIASAGFGTSGSFLTTSVHEEVNMLRVNIEALLTLT